MNEPLFLDTSGLMCLLDENDFRHAQANEHFKKARFLLTTNHVLAEFVPLAHVRKLNRENALDFLKALILLPRLELVWIDEDYHNRAMELLENRLDKTYSLCDAVSFVLMSERRMTNALTNDKRFEQENFVRLLES